MDDVAIFDTVLSADQIKELYEGRYLGELRPNQFGTTAGLWHLNGNSTDSSGNNNHGTDTAITYSQANGKFGQGAGFNGSTSKILLADNLFKYTGDFTASCWVNITALQDAGLIANYRYTGAYFGFGLNVKADGVVRFFTASGGGGVTELLSSNTLSTGIWYHVAVVRVNSTGSRIYVNGNLVGSDSNTTNPTYTTTHYPSLGVRRYDNAIYEAYLNGKLEEAQIASTALTANQIRTMYALGKGMYQ